MTTPKSVLPVKTNTNATTTATNAAAATATANEIIDQVTGLENQLIQTYDVKLTYTSTATQLRQQTDASNLARFEILKEETFNYYKNQTDQLDMLKLIRQLVADCEYVFYKDHKSGLQKQQLVYDAFIQYLFQVKNLQYDMLTKSNVLHMIDDVFRHNKHNLLQICASLHKGIKLGIKVIKTCCIDVK